MLFIVMKLSLLVYNIVGGKEVAFSSDAQVSSFKFKFIKKINKIQNMMYHCLQLTTAFRGEQWLDALD